MYKIEIKQVAKLSSTCPKKQTYIVYTKSEGKTKEFIQNIKDENEVIKKTSETDITYIERETSLLKRIKIKPCRNTNLPKLKTNQIWCRVYSSEKELKEIVLTDYYSKDDFNAFIKTRKLTEKYFAANVPEKNAIMYLDKYNNVQYASAIE